MADQNFMDLASKTASGITGTDYMMLVNNSEAYKALVNDVAEAILGKLTSKSFSGLETTAKNVIGALNELNSKSLLGYKLREKYIENAEIVIAGTTKVIRSGVTFSGTIPIFFYSTNRSGWQFLIFRHQNEYNDWLMALNDSADGTFSGYFYYLEEV